MATSGYYVRTAHSPSTLELAGLLRKTTGAAELLANALAPLEPTLALIFGSVASGTETAHSDVDLLVVGKAGLRELAVPLRDAAKRLGREVSPVVFSDAEFATKLKARNHFLRSVLDRPRLFVVGTEGDVRRASQAEARSGGASRGR